MPLFYYQQLQIAKIFLSIFTPGILFMQGMSFVSLAFITSILKLYFLSIEVGAQTPHLLLHTAAQQQKK